MIIGFRTVALEYSEQTNPLCVCVWGGGGGGGGQAIDHK